MERFYRIVFLGLFVLGFLGAVASADKAAQQQDEATNTELSNTASDESSLIRDVRLAAEINDLNSNNTNQDVTNINEDGLSRVEALLNSEDAAQSAQAKK